MQFVGGVGSVSVVIVVVVVVDTAVVVVAGAVVVVVVGASVVVVATVVVVSGARTDAVPLADEPQAPSNASASAATAVAHQVGNPRMASPDLATALGVRRRCQNLPWLEARLAEPPAEAFPPLPSTQPPFRVALDTVVAGEHFDVACCPGSSVEP